MHFYDGSVEASEHPAHRYFGNSQSIADSAQLKA
jgi:hypothetical protein